MRVLTGRCRQGDHVLVVSGNAALAELSAHSASVRGRKAAGPSPDPHLSTARWLGQHAPELLSEHGGPQHGDCRLPAGTLTVDLYSRGAVEQVLARHRGVTVTRTAGLERSYRVGGPVTWFDLTGERGEEVIPPPRRPAFVPSDEPWADYFRTICPGWETPENGRLAWRYASEGRALARDLWDLRESARGHFGAEGPHEPAVLRYREHFVPACLACTWITTTWWDEEIPARALAARHADQPHVEPAEVLRHVPAWPRRPGER